MSKKKSRIVSKKKSRKSIPVLVDRVSVTPQQPMPDAQPLVYPDLDEIDKKLSRRDDALPWSFLDVLRTALFIFGRTNAAVAEICEAFALWSKQTEAFRDETPFLTLCRGNPTINPGILKPRGGYLGP